MKELYKVVKKLRQRVAKLEQRRMEEKSYIKRLQRKHCGQMQIFAKVKAFSKHDFKKLRELADRNSLLKYAHEGGYGRYGKRYLVYLTRTQSAKLFTWLKKDKRCIDGRLK